MKTPTPTAPDANNTGLKTKHDAVHATSETSKSKAPTETPAPTIDQSTTAPSTEETKTATDVAVPTNEAGAAAFAMVALGGAAAILL